MVVGLTALGRRVSHCLMVLARVVQVVGTALSAVAASAVTAALGDSVRRDVHGPCPLVLWVGVGLGASRNRVVGRLLWHWPGAQPFTVAPLLHHGDSTALLVAAEIVILAAICAAALRTCMPSQGVDGIRQGEEALS